MKMQPLQIWLPRLGGSIQLPPIGRDAMRAFEFWRDEVVVWMLPEIRKPARWRKDGIRHLAVPSEQFDRIDIAHVTKDGHVHARTAKDLLPRTVDGLLAAWLNIQKGGGVRFVRPLESITINAPYVDRADKIAWRKRTVTIGPGTYMPVTSLNLEAHEVTMAWPPRRSPPSVSPEAESAQHFPSKKLESDPPTVITEQGHVALHVLLRWPDLLESMMPLFSGPDDMLAQAQMAKLARQSTSDLRGALRAAAVAARPYLSRGHSTVEQIWLRPTLEREGLRHVLFKGEDRGLTVPPHLRRRWDENALNEVLKQADWQKWLAETVPIRRAWGAVGLFWTLFLDHLEAQRSFIMCERCERMISGKDGKRFCGEGDDRECFKSRRALDQRRSRRGRTSAARSRPSGLR